MIDKIFSKHLHLGGKLPLKVSKVLLAVLILAGAIFGTQILNTNTAYAAGCKNEDGKVYKAVADCLPSASWDGTSINYGNSKFTKKRTQIIDEKYGEQIKRLGTNNADIYELSTRTGIRILVPAGTKPGDKLDRALLVLTPSNVRSYTDIEPDKIYKQIKIYEKADDIPDSEKTNEAGVKAGEGEDQEAPICNIGDGLGWLICPAATFSANLVDGAFSFLSGLMSYDTLVDKDSRETLLRQWALMRNVANIVFAAAFLMVVYSTMTNIGISNYNLKRMVPRLVVAAILVNSSFWLCTIAVDISNIAGNTVSGLMESAREVAVSTDPEEKGESLWLEKTAMVLSGGAIIGGIGAAGLSLSSLALLIPILFSALSAILLVILILVSRQALITLLVIISPLAFVAYILPNTSHWFDRWRKTFTTMLMIFPIVALLFSGSKLAATVVRLTGGADMDLLSLGIQALPLFAVPAILKSMGGVLTRIGALTNDKSRGLLDRGRNRLQSSVDMAKKKATSRDLQSSSKWRKYRHGVRSINLKNKESAAQAALEYSQTEYHNNRLLNDPAYLRAMSGGNPQMEAILKGNAAAAVDKQEQAAINGLATNYSAINPDTLRDRLKAGGQGDLEKAAMARVLLQKDKSLGTMEVLDNLVNESGSSTVRREIARGDHGSLIGAGQKAQIEAGATNAGKDIKLTDMYKESAMKWSPEQATKAGPGELGLLKDLAQTDQGLSQTMSRLADTISNNPQLSVQIGKTAPMWSDFRNGVYTGNTVAAASPAVARATTTPPAGGAAAAASNVQNTQSPSGGTTAGSTGSSSNNSSNNPWNSKNTINKKGT